MTAKQLPKQRLEKLRGIAKRKRQEDALFTVSAYRATTGFVIIWRNKAIDWIGSLAAPELERPGVYVVSCSGRVFRAGAGWEPVDGGPEWSDDELPLSAEKQERKDAVDLAIPHIEAKKLFHKLIERLLSRGYALDASFDYYTIRCMVNVCHETYQDAQPYSFNLYLRLKPYLENDSYISIHYFHKNDNASVERQYVTDWRRAVSQFCDLLEKSRKKYGLQFRRTCLPQ